MRRGVAGEVDEQVDPVGEDRLLQRFVIEPGRAGLTPEQVRRLFREVLQRFESITNEDAAEEAREYPDER